MRQTGTAFAMSAGKKFRPAGKTLHGCTRDFYLKSAGKLVSNFSMNDSKSEMDVNVERFTNAIQKKWNREAEPDKNNPFPCDLSPVPRRGNVYVFNLAQPPAGHPAAKQCFVWNARESMTFKKGDYGENVVLDVEVPCADDAIPPRKAVWAWLTGTLVKEKESDYVESKKWQPDKLHNQRVEFNFNNKIKTGVFLVRRREDGKISVRIVHAVQIKFDGIDEEKSDSFCLTQNQIDSILPPIKESKPFQLIL